MRGWYLVICSAVAIAGCSGDESGDGPGAGGDGGNPFGNPSGRDDAGPLRDAGLNPALDFTVSPGQAMLTVVHGEDLPSVQLQVESASGPVSPRFRVEDGTLGRIDDNGLFTASGTHGGVTFIEVRVGDLVKRVQVTIVIEWVQNGEDGPQAMPNPSGGYGGVGGEGPGGPVSEEVRKVLTGRPMPDAALRFLYPYDRTVFPLGLLAPLLMWSEGTAAAADGIALHLSGPHFDYRGYFGRPPALAAGAAFVRHPIPQAVWDAATRTVAGGGLKVELVLAKDGAVYGAIERSFTIAAGSLKGTVYYQSYGTKLAENYEGAMGGNGRFGGATLAIKPGATGPELVAGGNGGHDQCRVCHSVASDGSRMTVQQGDPFQYPKTSSYDLLNANTEMQYPPATDTLLGWIGLTPDGALGLGNGEPLAVRGQQVTQLYDMATGDVVPSTGLAEFVSEAAFPAFSHDGSMVAFNFWSGPGDAAIGQGDTRKLVIMDFDRAATAFSAPRLLYEGDLLPGWPSFSPTRNSVIFQVEVQRNDRNETFYTRYGGRGELWWANLRTGQAHELQRANGMENGASYLPEGANNHAADYELNYEPTVAPVASGGYAWMVFTSRRMYGNVATIDPWWSDPREHDLTATPTTKKLWVAAIDLDVSDPEFSGMVGEDPSHPAFYLPGQELLAGNTRGFWVVDPCKPDGESCESGVECCTGYCQADEDGNLTCGKTTDDCVQEFDRCEERADCCDPSQLCVNEVCTRIAVE
jgi:hypothetical protein